MNTVNGISNRILAAYDADGSGAIEFRGADQREMTRRQERVEPDPTAGAFGVDRHLVRVTTTCTQVSLFIAADADEDGVVSRDELTDTVGRFDADKDGKLSSRGWAFWQPPGELEQFEAQHPEQVVRIERTPL